MKSKNFDSITLEELKKEAKYNVDVLKSATLKELNLIIQYQIFVLDELERLKQEKERENKEK